jgi:hypothetical protein
VALIGLGGLEISAQVQKADSAQTLKRTAFGQPDIQGAWTAPGPYARDWVGTLEQGAAQISEGAPAARAAAGRGVGAAPTHWMVDGPESQAESWVNRTKVPHLVVDPANGRVPMQAWAAERRDKLRMATNNGADEQGNLNLEDLDPQTRCLPTGPPRSNYAVPYSGYHIVQTRDSVIILSEWNHLHRIILIRQGAAHPRPTVRLYMGDSIGHWEGNTLVVDTTNFNGKTWLDMGGTFHSDALHVVERYTVTDAQTLAYEATLEDRKVFTRPWKIAFEFKRPEKGYEIYEYACHEGNYGLTTIMNIARARKKAAEQGSLPK